MDAIHSLLIQASNVIQMELVAYFLEPAPLIWFRQAAKSAQMVSVFGKIKIP